MSSWRDRSWNSQGEPDAPPSANTSDRRRSRLSGVAVEQFVLDLFRAFGGVSHGHGESSVASTSFSNSGAKRSMT